MSEGASDTRAGEAVAALVRVMARLREPGGCPWDRAQDARTLKPYLIEEAYEVIDAIDDGDPAELTKELGDLLFQVVFHARLLEEAGDADLGAVAQSIVDKLTRRHPHVFGGDEAKAEAGPAPRTDGEMADRWEQLKAKERDARDELLLDSLPKHLPALTSASRICEKVAGVGFDWPDVAGVLEKLREELDELEQAIGGSDREAVHEELGDLLFVIANLGRKLGAPPEEALRDANRKFRERFAHIERRLRDQGKSPAEASLEEMDALWDEAKARGG